MHRESSSLSCFEAAAASKIYFYLKKIKYKFNYYDRNLLKKAGAKMKMRVATSAFNTWVEMVQEKLRIRGLLNRAAKKMKMRKASMVFNTWCEMVEERHREKNSMNKFQD